MKTSSARILFILVSGTIVLSVLMASCKKTENPIKFPKGFFPDTTIIMKDINSVYDDYNMDLHQLLGTVYMVFSSNRISSGGQFDLVQGVISFLFDQTNGAFSLETETFSDNFLTGLLNKANTLGDDFGPYRLFSTVDGYEYMILSSTNNDGNLDLYYLKNQPYSGTNSPEITGPLPVNLLNTISDDAYLCLDFNQDSVYFSSDVGGNFDIFVKGKPAEIDLATFFNGTYSSSSPVDSINSPADDKCPIINKNIMVFASNRPGGMGGFDLYYSVFKKGKWSFPINFGPDVNTSSDEYRPVISSFPDFTNNFMIFSSNRPGGKGGFDLYFRGFTFPE